MESKFYSTPELSQLHPGLENGLHANGGLYPLEVDILDVLFSTAVRISDRVLSGMGRNRVWWMVLQADETL